MITLFIDTHLFDLNIILFKDYDIIKQKNIVEKKNNSVFLLPSIKEVCDGYKIDQIIVVNGPGSFTGVRLGVTVAKTLAYTLNVPIKTISYLDMMNLSLNLDSCILGISDGNGYFIGEYLNNKLIKDFYYKKNSEIDNLSDIITDVSINYSNVLNSLTNVEAVNPHAVKPLYIKLISVEYDKKS